VELRAEVLGVSEGYLPVGIGSTSDSTLGFQKVGFSDFKDGSQCGDELFCR
jgi:hypothetical protein